jgi:hypothetical protein
MAQFNEKFVLCLTKYWIPNTGSKFRTLSKPFPNVRGNDMRSWNESIQFTIETNGEFSSTRQWILLFHKRWEISWLAEQLSAPWCPLYRSTDVAPCSFNFSRHKPVFKRLVIYSMSIESDGELWCQLFWCTAALLFEMRAVSELHQCQRVIRTKVGEVFKKYTTPQTEDERISWLWLQLLKAYRGHQRRIKMVSDLNRDVIRIKDASSMSAALF